MSNDGRSCARAAARCLAVLAAVLALGACQGAPDRVELILAPPPEEKSGWRGVATPEDAALIDRIADRWSGAAGAANKAANGPLLEPGAAVPRAALPPGSYRCRIFRLGAAARKPAFTAFRPFFCHVSHEGELLSLTKQTGAERPGGYLWEDGRDRMIFLGAVAFSGEKVPPPYGKRRERDMVGVLERVDAFRWRLAIPRSTPTSKLDVLELVPALPAETSGP